MCDTRHILPRDRLPSSQLKLSDYPDSLPVTVEPGDQYYECGEFPGGLISTDVSPDAYFKYAHDTPLEVSCWELDNTGELYLKTVEDNCFIREYYIYYNETLDITYETALPRCRPHRPFQAWWGHPGDSTIGGSIDTDMGACEYPASLIKFPLWVKTRAEISPFLNFRQQSLRLLLLLLLKYSQRSLLTPRSCRLSLPGSRLWIFSSRLPDDPRILLVKWNHCQWNQVSTKSMQVSQYVLY